MYYSMTLAALLITMMIMMLKMIMKMYSKNKSNKTPFECGFSKMIMMSKTPFSIQFFMLSIMFIIFDIEISILLTMINPTSSWKIKEWGIPSMMFLITMLMGIIYEWKESAMYWTK